MSESRNGLPAGAHAHSNGDSSKGTIKSDAAKGNYLSVLERQIEALEANQSR